MHVFERLGLVLLANFSLNVIGSHVLTRTVFVPVPMRLLNEIHSGLELPWRYSRVLPKEWGRGGGFLSHFLGDTIGCWGGGRGSSGGSTVASDFFFKF